MKCCVKGCISSKLNDQKITVHKLPRNPRKRKEWIDSLGEHNFRWEYKVVSVCSLHFEDSCFNRTLEVLRLRDEAKPTIVFPFKRKSAMRAKTRSRGRVTGDPEKDIQKHVISLGSKPPRIRPRPKSESDPDFEPSGEEPSDEDSDIQEKVISPILENYLSTLAPPQPESSEDCDDDDSDDDLEKQIKSSSVFKIQPRMPQPIVQVKAESASEHSEEEEEDIQKPRVPVIQLTPMIQFRNPDTVRPNHNPLMHQSLPRPMEQDWRPATVKLNNNSARPLLEIKPLPMATKKAPKQDVGLDPKLKMTNKNSVRPLLETQPLPMATKKAPKQDVDLDPKLKMTNKNSARPLLEIQPLPMATKKASKQDVDLDPKLKMTINNSTGPLLEIRPLPMPTKNAPKHNVGLNSEIRMTLDALAETVRNLRAKYINQNKKIRSLRESIRRARKRLDYYKKIDEERKRNKQPEERASAELDSEKIVSKQKETVSKNISNALDFIENDYILVVA